MKYKTLDEYNHEPENMDGWFRNDGVGTPKADLVPYVDLFYGGNTAGPHYRADVPTQKVIWYRDAAPAVSHWRPAVHPDSLSALDVQHGGSHYKDMDVQPWEAMEAWLTEDEYRGYHKGVAIAYLARERSKGGLEDIEKAIHHLQRLVEVAKDDA